MVSVLSSQWPRNVLMYTAIESLPGGAQTGWTTWKTLNQLHTRVGRCKANLVKWGYTAGSDTCECGERQTMDHLLTCPLLPSATTTDDLAEATDTALQCANYWRDSIGTAWTREEEAVNGIHLAEIKTLRASCLVVRLVRWTLKKNLNFEHCVLSAERLIRRKLQKTIWL